MPPQLNGEDQQDVQDDTQRKKPIEKRQKSNEVKIETKLTGKLNVDVPELVVDQAKSNADEEAHNNSSFVERLMNLAFRVLMPSKRVTQTKGVLFLWAVFWLSDWILDAPVEHISSFIIHVFIARYCHTSRLFSSTEILVYIGVSSTLSIIVLAFLERHLIMFLADAVLVGYMTILSRVQKQPVVSLLAFMCLVDVLFGLRGFPNYSLLLAFNFAFGFPVLVVCYRSGVTVASVLKKSKQPKEAKQQEPPSQQGEVRSTPVFKRRRRQSVKKRFAFLLGFATAETGSILDTLAGTKNPFETSTNTTTPQHTGGGGGYIERKYADPVWPVEGAREDTKTRGSEASTSSKLTRIMCPISVIVMKDPVKADDGFTYERTAILRWMKNKKHSPMTGLPFANTDIRPDMTMRKVIVDLGYPVASLAPDYKQAPPQVRSALHAQLVDRQLRFNEWQSAKKRLSRGQNFIKYGRRRNPKLRFVSLSADGKSIEWRRYSNTSVRAGIRVSDINEVVKGRRTPVFKKQKPLAHNIFREFGRHLLDNAQLDARSFSLLGATRTLDLEAPNSLIAHQWATDLGIYLREAL